MSQGLSANDKGGCPVPQPASDQTSSIQNIVQLHTDAVYSTAQHFEGILTAMITMLADVRSILFFSVHADFWEHTAGGCIAKH